MILSVSIIEILKLIGGLAGIAALTWKFYDIREQYIKLKIEVRQDNFSTSVLTQIENSNISKKTIDYACLIISPENVDIITAMNRIICPNQNNIQNIANSQIPNIGTSTYTYNRYAIIPLTYFFSGIENKHIKDETMTYRSSLDVSKLNKGNYSVRFYVYCNGKFPRSSQDLLVVH